MKRTSLTFLIAVLLSMVGTNAYADFDTNNKEQVGALFYNFDDENNTARVACFNSVVGDITIPSLIEYNNKQYSVTSIGDKAFFRCLGLTFITIPNSVKCIGKNAFWGCSNLTSITIPNSVTSIGEGAFGCSGLISITIGDGLTTIGDGVFDSCLGLTSITIPNSVTSIGYYTFYGCSGLTSITIPNSVTFVGEDAFAGTAWYINQPDGVVYAGKNVYRYKGDMPDNTSIVIEDGTFSITHGAFSNCIGLTSVTIPNSVTSIGENAFSGCTGLTSVTIPNSVTSIDDNAFLFCYNLTSVTFGHGLTSIGNRTFYGCSGLTSITIPNSVTSIGNDTFYCCSSLVSVTIGNGMTSIGDYAFGDSKILKDVYCYAEEVPNTRTDILSYPWDDDSPIINVTLHVPAASIEDYSNTKPWKNFRYIVALTDDDTKPTELTNINNDTSKGERYYSLDGKRMSQPQRGLNIIRKSDGTTSKVVVK